MSSSKYDSDSTGCIKRLNVLFFRFSDKTKNDWEDKDIFTKVPGKYDLIIVDYNAEVTQASPHVYCNFANLKDHAKQSMVVQKPD